MEYDNSDKETFLERLKQRRGHESQSTPMKRRRALDVHAIGSEQGVSCSNNTEEDIEVFDLSTESTVAEKGPLLKESEDGDEIQVFDLTVSSLANDTVDGNELEVGGPIEVFDTSLSSGDYQMIPETAENGVSPSTSCTSRNERTGTSDNLKDCTSRTDGDILRLLSVTCCTDRCLRKLSMDDITFCESYLKSKEQTAQRNEVLTYLHKHSKFVTGGYQTEFFAAGRKVCKDAWLLIHDLKKDTFRRIYSEFQKGTLHIEHGNWGIKRPSQKTKDCIAWLEFFVNCVGQHQPDQSSIHLPSCFSLLSIYKQMVCENDGFGITSVGLSQFYNIFHKYFPHISIPKENRFTKCTDCSKYKEQKEKTMDKKVRSEIDTLLNKHLELVWQERRVYYQHRYKSRRFPEKYLTVIDDGMDQKTTNIPRVRRKTKATCNLTTIGTHLVGAILHSGQSPTGKDIYGSFDFYQWPHDPNLTISVLLKMISEWSKCYKLPPVFNLQLDNCVKENKNQYMIWMLALLVELFVFDKIKMNFLPVGHTHEDIDGFFGVYSQHLDQNDVYTADEMLKAMENCLHTINVRAFLLKDVYNIKEWLTPHAHELHDHTQPKSFKFIRNASGKCEMFYRNYSHMQWEGPVVVLRTLPTDKPNLVKPGLNKIDVEGLRRDLVKFEEHYPSHAVLFWRNWLDKIADLVTLPEEWEWPLEELQAAEKVRPSAVERTLPEQLHALQDKEAHPTRQIYTGRYVTPRERENPVEHVESFLEGLCVSKFVAVYLSNWDKEPVIGVIEEVMEKDFKIHYWKGSYRGKWGPLNLPRSQEPWTEILPKECIILHAFELSEAMKLQPTTRRHLVDKYASLKSREEDGH